MIIGYKAFDSESSFVEWQKEKTRKIFQISPVIHSMSGTARGTGDNDVDVNTGFGCFVTYELEEDNNE